MATLGLGGASYAAVTVLGLREGRLAWPLALIPAACIGAFIALQAVDRGRMRAAAIGRTETGLILAYAMLLTWTLQLVLRFLPPGSPWAWAPGLIPAAACLLAARHLQVRPGRRSGRPVRRRHA